jgi:hypothetical protein
MLAEGRFLTLSIILLFTDNKYPTAMTRGGTRQSFIPASPPVEEFKPLPIKTVDFIAPSRRQGEP